MAIVSGVEPVTLPVPHEEGETITIRMLSHDDMLDINNARIDGALKLAENVSDRMLNRDSKKPQDMTPQERAEAARQEKYNTYGQFLTLLKAITGWSYTRTDGSDIPVTPENVRDLDAKTADWLFRHIVDSNTYELTEGEALNAPHAAITSGAEATPTNGSTSN